MFGVIETKLEYRPAHSRGRSMTSQYSTPKRKIVILYKILKLKIIFEITIFSETIFEKDLQGFWQ